MWIAEDGSHGSIDWLHGSQLLAMHLAKNHDGEGCPHATVNHVPLRVPYVPLRTEVGIRGATKRERCSKFEDFE